MNKILISRTDKLGDVILSLPVIAALRNKFPDSQIYFLAQHYTGDILECSPHLNGIIQIDDETGIRKPVRSLALEIKQYRFDCAIILFPTLYTVLASVLGGIPERVGSGFRWYSVLFTKRVYEHRKTCAKHEVEYNLGLLQSYNIDNQNITFDLDIPEKETDTVSEILKSSGINDEDLLIIIHPGSKGSSLDWSPDNIPELVDLIRSNFKTKILLTGTQAEQNVLNNTADKCREKPVCLENQLTLKEFAALLKRANLVIANSTGPLHLANAVGTEVIGIYPGIIPINPVRWGPYGKSDSVITPKTPEGTKWNKKNYIEQRIMDTISPENIFALIKKKLDK